MAKNKTKAIFLDRDGTINQDSGFISNPEDFDIYPYSAQAIKLFNDNGFYVFIVTNQSGIARGLLTFKDLELIHHKMLSQLAAQSAVIDNIFISPYYREGHVVPYNIFHRDRKPGIGLFYQALKTYSFDLKESYMIGDRYTDIIFGREAGLKTILVTSGEGEKEFLTNRQNWQRSPHYVVTDLLTAAEFIVAKDV